MSREKLLKHIVILFVAVLAVDLGVYAFQWFGDQKKPFQASLETAAAETPPLPQVAPALPKPKPEPAKPAVPTRVDAEAAISVQVVSGQATTLLSQSADKPLPIASLTKLMTALVVLEKYDLNQPVTISADAMAVEGEQGNLQQGQVLKVKDLLEIMLIESSNRAAYALAENIGVDPFIVAMNEQAQVLGLDNTHFVDSSGLADGSYSTAADIAKLTQYLLENYPLFGEIIASGQLPVYFDNGDLHHVAMTTNQLLGRDGITGGKTGYTDSAKGCFMAVQSSVLGYRINVVLGADDRFAQMETLIKLTP